MTTEPTQLWRDTSILWLLFFSHDYGRSEYPTLFKIHFYDYIFWHLTDSIGFSTFLKHQRNNANTEITLEPRLWSVQEGLKSYWV